MTPNDPPRERYSHKLRIRKIKEFYKNGVTHIPTIATACGVYEKTIDRDLAKWRRNGGFEKWLKELWIESYGNARKEDKIVVFKELTRLLARTLTQKVEQTTKLKGEVKVDIPELDGLSEDAVTAIVENFLEDEARRLRQADSAAVQGPENSP